MCCPLRTRSTNGLLTTSYYVHACSSDYPWLSKYSVLRTNTTTVQLRSTKKSFLHLTFPGTDRVQSPRSHINSVPWTFWDQSPNSHREVSARVRIQSVDDNPASWQSRNVTFRILEDSVLFVWALWIIDHSAYSVSSVEYRFSTE